MNNYSSSVMEGGFLVPDVETYTSAAVFTLGKSSETTGYWCHGLQVWKFNCSFLVTYSDQSDKYVLKHEYFLIISHRLEL